MNDTHPDAEHVQIELLRKMTPDRRGRIGSMLTNQSRWRTRQAIARANPDLPQGERELLLLEFVYGRDMAQRVRAHLKERSHGNAR